MTSFVLWWWVSFAVLLILASWWGRQSGEGGPEKNTLAILIDSRGRISLTHLQIVMWTLLVLATFLGLVITELIANWSSFDTKVLEIPNPLLALLGISVGSATAAGAVKSAKDLQDQTPGQPRVARAGVKVRSLVDNSTEREVQPALRQVITQEEGPHADQVVDVTKFQNFIFTAVLGVVYVVLTMQAKGYPELSEQVIWLIGISHAGYVAGKLPDRGPINS